MISYEFWFTNNSVGYQLIYNNREQANVKLLGLLPRVMNGQGRQRVSSITISITAQITTIGNLSFVQITIK